MSKHDALTAHIIKVVTRSVSEKCSSSLTIIAKTNRETENGRKIEKEEIENNDVC